MENPEKDDFDFGEFGRIFDDFFSAGIIKDASYDLIKTRTGNYFCRNCATKVKHSQNCPNCNKNIDWNKRCIGMEEFVVVLLNGGKSDIVLEPIKEFADRVKSLSDNELMSLSEGLFDNPKKLDAELIQASNWEVTRRFRNSFPKQGTFFQRLFSYPFSPKSESFNKQQYDTWNKHRALIEAKATEFVLEKIQKKK